MSGPQQMRPAAAPPALRLARDEDAQDLFGLLALCFAEYPGCLVDPHDDLSDLLAPGSLYGSGRRVLCPRRRARPYPGLRRRRFSRAGHGRAAPPLRPPRPAPPGPRRVPRPSRRGSRRARGARRLFFWSDTRFKPAHRLYAALGYAQAPGASANSATCRDRGNIASRRFFPEFFALVGPLQTGR